jgi:tetratricopeptide (TPR) repeat protein
MLPAVKGSYMLLYVSVASRLAPLLLGLSFVLVGTRWLHDLAALRARRLNAVAAIVFMVAGLAAIVPTAIRMGLIVGIPIAATHGDFDLAAARIDQYLRWGGRPEGNLLFLRGMANARDGRMAEAINDFGAAARSNDPLVPQSTAAFNAALCFYALHDDARAERILLHLPDAMTEAPARFYCLGRIAEHRNDTAGAEQWFRRSLAAQPDFTPALYRLLRIVSLRHDLAGADAVAATFRQKNPGADAPYLADILAAIHHGEVLADYDPYHVSI